MPCTLLNLVDDIIIQILKGLAVSDVLSLRLTSKHLEMLSRLANVWYSIFVRDVLSHGRPIPGYAIPRTFPQSNEHAQTIGSGTVSDSADLEARTRHALRLDESWRKLEILTPNKLAMSPKTLSFKPTSPCAVVNVFLVPGGRYLLLVHVDGVYLWDLGFPTFPAFQRRDTGADPSMMEKWVFEWSAATATFNVALDAAAKSSVGEEMKILLGYCTSTTLTVISLDLDSLKSWSSNEDEHRRSNDSVFKLEKRLQLPPSLSPPRDSGLRKDDSINYGTLGQFIHMYSDYCFFESLAPTQELKLNSTPDSRKERYVGLEILDLSQSEAMENTTLLVYPGPEVGGFIDMYVQECTQHVIVAWDCCIGVYPLRETTSSEAYPPGRAILFPTIVFALAERIAQPTAFTPCSPRNESGARTAPCISLTIVAQSAGNMGRTVQSILTTIASTPGTATLEYDFRLARVPIREYDEDIPQMLTIALGPSGRGICVEEDGSLYSCSPSNVIVPSLRYTPNGGVLSAREHGEEVFSGGLVKTVVFWPYRKIGDAMAPPDQDNKSNHSLAVRFDDGMGRLVFTHVSSISEVKLSPEPVMIIDFA